MKGREYRCRSCGKRCIDDYDDINEYNERELCDECVDNFWNWKWGRQQND